VSQTQERPGIEITDAPECWNIPEKEPEVYWVAWGWMLDGYERRWVVRNQPREDLLWRGLTAEDAERDARDDQAFEFDEVTAETVKEASVEATHAGREGVGIYTYEGGEKVCVRYWLLGDPIPEASK